MTAGKLHRDSNGDMARFAWAFLEQRLRGFRKDMEICFTGVPSKERSRLTHAYFPALMACCGALEYVTQLHDGMVKTRQDQDIARFAAKFLPQPDYDKHACRILFDMIRNKVAHHGIASGIWVDEYQGRRITWKIHADTGSPSIDVKAEPGVLLQDPPWPAPYTHRVHIRLGRLWRDIEESVLGASGYRHALMADPVLLKAFEKCMHELYPKSP